MCGIAVKIGCEGNPVDSLAAMSHRGPDAEGQWLGEDVWLGHRRLAIVDLSDAGRQPMQNETGDLRLVCNGEIYNYPVLRAHLESQGHRFSSDSDSEVILHAYEQWGDDCIHRLEGMFAFALWDDRRRRLLAARDRLGIKPLYLWEGDNGSLALASEAGGLLELLPHTPRPDPLAMAYVMTLGYVPSPLSVWEGVAKVEPATMLIWERRRTLLRRYWEPPRGVDSTVFPDASAEHFQSLFTEVTRDHLLSDVPIGLFLSGGLDSSSVAACLHELGQAPSALTVTYPGSQFDEGPIARRLAAHLSMEHKQISLCVGDVDRLIGDTAAAYDEPQGYSALVSMYLLCRTTAERFRVVLAGDGGDEVFGGYRWYDDLEDHGFRSTRRWVRRALRPIAARRTPTRLLRLAFHHFPRCSPLHRHAWRLFPRFLPEEVAWLLAPSGIEFNDDRMLAPLRRHFEPRLPLKRALQRVDLMTFCCDSILAKVDRASMAFSLEVRVPMLDRRIVEWGLTRPVSERETSESKPALRDYLAGRVPNQVLAHPKQGFSLRVLDRFSWDTAMEQIAQGPWVREGYWNTRWRRLVRPGVPFRVGRIWTLLALTRWAEHWLGRSRPSSDSQPRQEAA